MSAVIEQVRIPYRPRWFQRKTHEELQRFNVLVFHRRAGKTVLAVNELIKQIINEPLPNARGHYIAPFYSQVKRIAWTYLKQYTAAIPGMEYNKSDLVATFPHGGEIQLIGGDNFDSHRGVYSDYCILDEPAQMHPAIWGEIFRPALSDREGGAIFIGTPKGHNQFYDRWVKASTLPGWYRRMYKVTETGALPIDEIRAVKREQTKAEFDQEYMCNFEAAIKGAIYGEQMTELENSTPPRITSVPHDPNYQVQTSWDLGVKHRTVVCYWQTVGAERRMIDCDAYQHTGLDKMFKAMKSKPYSYSQHIAPHDISVFEIGSGMSRFDRAQELGVYFDKAPRFSLQDGIDATRATLPTMVIDANKCSDCIEALKLYRTDYDAKQLTFKAKPVDDWTSDYADSVRYYCITPPDITGDLFGAPLDYSRDNRTVI